MEHQTGNATDQKPILGREKVNLPEKNDPKYAKYISEQLKKDYTEGGDWSA